MRTKEEYKLLEYAHKIKDYCNNRPVCEGCIFRQSKWACHLTSAFQMGYPEYEDSFFPCNWFEKKTEVE